MEMVETQTVANQSQWKVDPIDMQCYRCHQWPCECSDGITILNGDSREVLRCLPDASVQCCVTSPPYWGLRDYGVEGQLGLEPTPNEYVANMVAVFAEVRRVLKDNGTLWLNLGDSYNSNLAGLSAGGIQGNQPRDGISPAYTSDRIHGTGKSKYKSLKPKDLIGIPWRVAFALQADGWYLRQDIVWHKPNPLPESVTDRCTKAHEFIFLLSKSARYYYDAEAIKEPCSESTRARISQDLMQQVGSYRANGGGKTNGPMKAVVAGSTRKLAEARSGVKANTSTAVSMCMPVSTRNKRSVWTIPTQAYSEAHFATFPEKLVEPCILAGCPEGGIVLDPFNGSGTTGVVCYKHRRQYVGIELNEEYAKMAQKRLAKEVSKFALLEQ